MKLDIPKEMLSKAILVKWKGKEEVEIGIPTFINRNASHYTSLTTGVVHCLTITKSQAEYVIEIGGEVINTEIKVSNSNDRVMEYRGLLSNFQIELFCVRNGRRYITYTYFVEPCNKELRKAQTNVIRAKEAYEKALEAYEATQL